MIEDDCDPTLWPIFPMWTCSLCGRRNSRWRKVCGGFFKPERCMGAKP